VQVLCRKVWELLFVLLLARTRLRSENRVVLCATFPERTVSFRPLLVHVHKRVVSCRPVFVPWPLRCGVIRIDFSGCSEGLGLPRALFQC